MVIDFMKYILEHLEPKLFSWCKIEYEHISNILGKENLIFSNIKTQSQREYLTKLGTVYKESIRQLAETQFKHKKICLLDSQAEKTLAPDDSKIFDMLVLGGILGDNPPKHRTILELGLLRAEQRNMGDRQMPTDTAAYVAKEILLGKKIDEFEFIDEIEIELKKGESVILPFRYVVVDGNILLSGKLIEYLKKKKGF